MADDGSDGLQLFAGMAERGVSTYEGGWRGERGAWRKRCGGEARAIAIAVEGEPNSILAELPVIVVTYMTSPQADWVSARVAPRTIG